MSLDDVELQELVSDDPDDSFVMSVGSSYLARVQGRLQKTLAQNKKLSREPTKDEVPENGSMTSTLSTSDVDVFRDSAEPSGTPYMSAVESPHSSTEDRTSGNTTPRQHKPIQIMNTVITSRSLSTPTNHNAHNDDLYNRSTLSADSLDESLNNFPDSKSAVFDITQSYCLGQGMRSDPEELTHQISGESGLHCNITVRCKQSPRSRMMSASDVSTSEHTNILSNTVPHVDGSYVWQSPLARRVLSKSSVTAEDNIVKPKALPETIDFKHLEKFEGGFYKYLKVYGSIEFIFNVYLLFIVLYLF